LSNYVLEAMQKEGDPLFNELCAAEMKTGKAVNVKKDDPDKDTDTKKKRKTPRKMTRSPRRRNGQSHRRLWLHQMIPLTRTRRMIEPRPPLCTATRFATQFCAFDQILR
jgi:hypothetical protein